MNATRLIALHGPSLIYAVIAGGVWSMVLVWFGQALERRKRHAVVAAELARREGVKVAVLAERCESLERENEHLVLALRASGIHIDEAYELRRRRA